MSESGSFVEKREHPRFAKNMSVQVKNLAHDVSGSLKPEVPGKDIGKGGICFFSSTPYEAGEELDLLIRIGNSEESTRRRSIWVSISSIPYAAKGKVVRCGEIPGEGGYFEVGVMFTDIDEDDLKALMRHMEE